MYIKMSLSKLIREKFEEVFLLSGSWVGLSVASIITAFNVFRTTYMKHRTLLYTKIACICASRLLGQERIPQLSLGHILKNKKKMQEGISVLIW